MTCPICNEKTVVVYCYSESDIISRRRKCTKCNHFFYTLETESDDAHKIFLEMAKDKERKRRRKNKERVC